MALATTCPQCKTSFKVVPDQLKLRRGLVRCGVCQFVFSGVEHLRYVDKDDDADPTTIQHVPDTTSGPSTASGAPEPGNRTPESRYNDVAAGLTFSDTHPGSGPLDSDTTDPVTQTLIAASEQGNNTETAQVDEDGAVAQPWPSLTMTSRTGTHTGTDSSTTDASDGAGASGTEGGTDSAASTDGTNTAGTTDDAAAGADHDATGGHAAGASGTTGTNVPATADSPTDTAAEKAGTAGTDADTSPATGTGQAGSTDEDAATTPATTPAPAPAAHTATDGAPAGAPPASAVTTDTSATDATGNTSSSDMSTGSRGKDGSRKNKGKSGRGQSRWSKFMKGRSPAPAPASEPASEPAPEPAPEHAPTAPQRSAVQEDDTSLNTVFFMADNEAPLPGHEHEKNVQLPASLRSGNSGNSQPPSDSDLDPDTQAASALVDEANRIWRQHKPRHTPDTDDGQNRNAPAGPGSDTTEGSTSHSSSREASRSRRSSDGSRRRRHRRSSSHTREGLGSLRDDGFTHEAAESAGWFTPKRRRGLMIALGILAAVQLVAVYRTEISYTVPFLRPVAGAVSMLTGQTIQPPMNLSALSIESFELRNTQKAGQTRMTAILRNRSGTATRWPAMELTLTGPSNAILVRKVLLPSQYLPAGHSQAAGMAPNSEQPLDLMLDTSDLNLAGYSVSLFYP